MKHINLKLTLFIFIYFKKIFPYLIIFVNLKNILIITKSVVSTPIDLNIRLKIAQNQSTKSKSKKNIYQIYHLI